MNIFTVQKTRSPAANRRQPPLAQRTNDGLQFMEPGKEEMIGCISNHTESAEIDRKHSSLVHAARKSSGENRKDETR